MNNTILTAILLTLTTPAFAQQSHELPDGPTPKSDATLLAERHNANRERVNFLKEKIKKPRVVDKQFLITVGALAAAKTTDAVTTQRALNRGCHETNTILGPHPSEARLGTVNAAFFAGEVTLAYVLKKTFGKSENRLLKNVWLGEPTYQFGDHLFFAQHNERADCSLM